MSSTLCEPSGVHPINRGHSDYMYTEGQKPNSPVNISSKNGGIKFVTSQPAVSLSPSTSQTDDFNDSSENVRSFENGSDKHCQLWRCVFCHSADVDASGLKVMSCLHIACTKCLRREAKLHALPGSQSIVSCAVCNYKMKFEHEDTSHFKGLPKCMLSASGQTDGPCDDLGTPSDYTNLPHCCGGIVSDDKLRLSAVVYCNACDMLVCDPCRGVLHGGHAATGLQHMLNTKHVYMGELADEIAAKIGRHHEKAGMVGTGKENLGKLRDELRDDITCRAENLVAMINGKKQTMIAELERVYADYMRRYDSSIIRLNDEVDTMVSSYEFASRLIDGGINDDILLFHEEVTNRLNYLNHKIEDAQIEILNMELEVPDRGREEAYAEKLFGSLIKGNVTCGDAELVSSFHIDLHWPSSLAATNANTFVVAGKTGAFETNGKLSFYNRQGQLTLEHAFPDGRVPSDVICAPSGCLWVSDNRGHVMKFSASGVVLETWTDKFKGGGHLAMALDECILVSSLEDKCVFKYDRRGELVQKIPDCDSFQLIPHCIASNHNGDVIIADHQAGAVFAFNTKSVMQFKFGGYDTEAAILKCPSDVCTDPFNNILVADFTNDRVILISKTGQFLGYLLTAENGISCPNFISLDQEGHLFVGQYGGDIHVFRYLSYVKNI